MKAIFAPSNLFTCFILLAMPASFSQAFATQKITVAASDFPPYFIFNHHPQGLKISGFEVDLDKQISARLNVSFEYVPCPWIRCLKLLQEGKIDMASTILKSEQRQQFLHYLEPGYQLVNQSRHVYFYKRKNDPRHIIRFSDLIGENLVIGVVRGDVHFPQFDQADNINKFKISSYPEGLDLLLKNKLDLVAMLETQSDWLQDEYQGQVSMTEFVHREQTIAYRALAKKGRALAYQKALSRVLVRLKKEGVFSHLQEKYRHQIR